MNKDLWALAGQSLVRRRRNTLLLFAVLFLSFAFSVGSLAVTGTIAKTNREYLINTYGAWMGAITDGSTKDEEFLREAEWLDTLGITRTTGTVRLGKSNGNVRRGASEISIGTADEGFFEMSRFTLQEGRMPRAADEVAIEASTLRELGIDSKPGQTITLGIDFPTAGKPVEVDIELKLCGVLQPYSAVWGIWSNYGYQVLNNAFVSGDGFQRLRDMAEEKLREETANAKTGAKKKTLSYVQTHYFFTFQGSTEQEINEAVKEHFSGKGSPAYSRSRLRNYIRFNYAAYGESIDPNVTTTEAGRDDTTALAYIAFIFAAVLLAVFCIYAVQMQRQVRQFALFRSIGITRRQLRRMVLFETLMLCVPAALLGAAAGTLGAAVLIKLLGMRSADIYVVVPWELLLPMAAVWMVGVLLARLIILRIALHEPLTGRISSDSRKLRRYRRLRVAMAGSLGVLLCGSLIFSVAESFPPAHQLAMENAKPSYMVRSYDGIQAYHMEQWQDIMGVTGVRAVSDLAPYLCFEGEENAQAFQDVLSRLRENDPVTGFTELSQLEESGMVTGLTDMTTIDDQMAFKVHLYVVPDDDPDAFLDLSSSGMDMDAFRRGEQVAVSFPQDPDGSFYMDSIVYRQVLKRSMNLAKGEEVETQDYKLHKDASDTGLQPGTTVTLDFSSTNVLEMTPELALKLGFDSDYAEYVAWCQANDIAVYSPIEHAAVLHPTVGAVVPVPSGTDASNLGLDERVYVFWCSEGFARNLVEDASARYPGVEIHFGVYNYARTEPASSYAEVFSDKTTGAYTDVEMEIAAYDAGLDFAAQRRENSSAAQEHIQSLILLLASGGCIALLLLLVLGNTLVMESERLKKNYGIMQALGMSRKQLRQRLALSALRRGLAGAALGWAIWGCYGLARAAMLYVSQLNAPTALRYEPMQALKETLWRYLYAGAGAGTAALLTALAVALVAAAYLFANRGLFRENLMDKLREE